MIKTLIAPTVVPLATIMLAFGNAAALAGSVECGAEIFVDTKLDADIDCRDDPGVDGIVIGAPGITLNLNGFTIIGESISGASGIFNDCCDDVTIKNGAISGFQDGVRIDGVADPVIKGVTFSDQVLSSIVVINSAGVLIKEIFISQPPGDGVNPAEAIRLANVNGATVKNATVDGGYFGLLSLGDPGIGGTGTATEILVKNSVFTNANHGIFLVRTLESRIVGNEVSDSKGIGIGLVEDSTGNIITLNISTGNDDVDMFHDEGSSPNEWINNTTVNPSRINNNPKFALRSCVLNIAVSKS